MSRTRAPIKQPSSELQLNASDGQYVVAYTLKPAKQAQPDILNPPPSKLLISYFSLIVLYGWGCWTKKELDKRMHVAVMQIIKRKYDVKGMDKISSLMGSYLQLRTKKWPREIERLTQFDAPDQCSAAINKQQEGGAEGIDNITYTHKITPFPFRVGRYHVSPHATILTHLLFFIHFHKRFCRWLPVVWTLA